MSKLQRIEDVLLFLTLLFLPTQLGRHFWPQFSFLYSLPIDYLSPTIYFWDLLVILLITFFLLGQKAINKLALNIFLIFMLTQLISLTPYVSSSLNLGAGLIRVEQYLIAGMFGVYLASKHLDQIKSTVFKALGLAILGESILAILQFLKGETLNFWLLGERTFSLSTPGIAKFDFYQRQFLRPYATFPHPNVLAAFMVLTTLLLLLSRPLISKTFTLIGLLAALTTLLTVSRVGISAGLVSALLLLKTKGRLLLVALFFLLLPILYTRFSSVFNFDNLALLRREELGEVAFKIFLSSPLLGVGLNNFIPHASGQLLIGPSRFLQPVHNIFLLSLSETGILGLLGFLGLIGYPILRVFKSPTFLLIWAVVIFLGMFDHYFLTLPQGYRLLFLIWGISFSMLE